MKLKVRSVGLDSQEPLVILNNDDCLTMGVDINDKVRLVCDDPRILSVAISYDPRTKGTASIPFDIISRCGIAEDDEMEVEYSAPPESIRSIKKKINGGTLDRREIDSIVSDINEGSLTDREILAFVSAFNVNNSSISEMADLTRSMASTGSSITEQ